jgi:hypothetical protein
VKEKHPSLVFFMETKLQAHRFEAIRVRLGFQNIFVVDSMGRSGGLALFWTEHQSIDIQNYSRRHINAIIKSEGVAQPWKFTGFYGHPEVGHRIESWHLLGHLCFYDPAPWLCVGDFNEILADDEK